MTETLSPSFSETLPGYDPVDLEDLELRQKARPLHSLDATVVRDPRDHPSFPTVCDVDGAFDLVLTHCGRPLCMPCQRKRVARQVSLVMRAVYLLKAERDRVLEAENRHLDFRFPTVTLKVRPEHSLASETDRIKMCYSRLRRTAFWKRCDVRGDLPHIEFERMVRFDLDADRATDRFDALIMPRLRSRTRQWHQGELDSPTVIDVVHRLVLDSVWSTVLELTDWYVHVHSLVMSAFMPAGPDYERELKEHMRRPRREGNLRDEWHAITGDSYIVKIESVQDDVSLVRELVKYVEKPTDDMDESIESWPIEARQEAAATLAGPHRTRWYCKSHHARKRTTCLGAKEGYDRTALALIGTGRKHKDPFCCDGEYRKERTGFRPLLPTGLFRCAIRLAKGDLGHCCGCCAWDDFCEYQWSHGETGLCQPVGHINVCAVRTASFDLPKREHNCRHCGLGNLRGLSWWEHHDYPNAAIALNSIQAYETTDDVDEPLGRRPNLMAEMPAGWIPPPPFTNYRPEIRLPIIEILENEPHALEALFDVWCPDRDPSAKQLDRNLDTILLGVLSLENLEYIFRDSHGVYSVNPRKTKGLVDAWSRAKYEKIRVDGPPREDPGSSPGSSAETPGAICDSEDRVDHWRSSSPFSGGIE